MTVSTTWMTPFDWSTSAMVTVATPPVSSVSVILSPSIFACRVQPPTVLTGCVPPSSAIILPIAADIVCEPASTPPAVIERLNKAVNEALKDAEVRAMIENTGGMVMGGTPQAYGKFIEAERAKWGPVIKNANITLD